MKSGYFFVVLLLLNIFGSYLNFNIFVESFETNGRCETLLETSQCYNTLVNHNIYLIVNQTQQETEDILSYLIGAASLTGNQTCIASFKGLVCLKNYQPCQTFTFNTNSISLPSYPCQSFCDLNEYECSNYISLFPNEYKCNYTTVDGPQYPDNSTIYDLTSIGGPSNQTIQCTADGVTANSGEVDVPCPSPLIKVSQEDLDTKKNYFAIGQCAIPCPFHILTKYQEKVSYYTKAVVYFLSFFGSIFLILSFVVMAGKYSKKYEIILSFTAATIIVDISYFLEFSKPDLEFVCADNDPGRFISQESDMRCGWSGFLYQFGTMGTFIWWSVACYDVFLTSRIKKNIYFKFIRIGAWTLTILFGLIPLMGKTYNSSLISYGCWIYAPTHTDAWQYTLYYVPSWIMVLIIFIFTCYGVYNIAKMYKEYPNRNVAIYNMKIVFLMIYLLFVITYNSFFKFYLKESVYEELLVEWVDCLYRTQNSLVSHDERCPLNLPGFAFRYVGTITTASIGFMAFLVYGIDPNMINVWRNSRVSKAVANKVTSTVNNLTSRSSSKTPSSSSSSSSSNNRKSSRSSSIKMKKTSGSESSLSESRDILVNSQSDNNSNSSSVNNLNNNSISITTQSSSFVQNDSTSTISNTVDNDEEPCTD
ncbi:frizzled and smoothened-like protein [Tieghemostelium lacteum]|uniref:Frizzled and smoothened-like protein n=1 Tax=Tieghemostelium lacteum TaxID=361077 RepID=A0A151ZA28_TIELA|nr:frizzled and smoothened-like protein [Tieghemostelium lacteum]|eukprot:KYQ90724.1 frizzled and smoothened-like protein [Tieghemostelium lacteum]